MSGLILTPNLAQPDEVYSALIAVHAGLTEADSLMVNARLVLILVNHVGNEATVLDAINVAGGRSGVAMRTYADDVVQIGGGTLTSGRD